MTRGELVAVVLGFFIGWTLRPLYELLAMQWKAERMARARDRELEKYLRPVRPPPRRQRANGEPALRLVPPPNPPPPSVMSDGRLIARCARCSNPARQKSNYCEFHWKELVRGRDGS